MSLGLKGEGEGEVNRTRKHNRDTEWWLREADTPRWSEERNLGEQIP